MNIVARFDAAALRLYLILPGSCAEYQYGAGRRSPRTRNIVCHRFRDSVLYLY
jgi:hypothetical protein